MNNVMKPISILRDEFIDKLATVINESGLPAFVITPILKDVLSEVQNAERVQLEQDRRFYEIEKNKAKEQNQAKEQDEKVTTDKE